MAGRLQSLIDDSKELKQLYRLEAEMGRGCFGIVFKCISKSTDRPCVLKIEKTSKNLEKQTLYKEYSILKLLQGIEGVPSVSAYGRTDTLNYLEMTLLSYDLEHQINKLSIIQVNQLCDLSIQLITILKAIHIRGVIHRDLKPQNIMFDEIGKPYIIDFGISTLRRGKYLKKRKSSQDIMNFVGTPRYASIAAHLGFQIMPKDDIQSLIYVLIYAKNKQLPWMNIRSTKNKVDAIGNIKCKTSRGQLTSNMPKCFYSSLEYLSRLKDNEKVDYDHLIQMFQMQRNVKWHTVSMKNISQTDLKDKKQLKRQRSAGRLNTIEKDLNKLLPPQDTITPEIERASDRVIFQIMTKMILQDIEDQLMQVEEQMQLGEQTLDTKVKALRCVKPKLIIKDIRLAH